MRWLAPVLSLLLFGCGGSAPPPAPGRPAPAEDLPVAEDAPEPAPEAPKEAGKSDGPHISRSVGEKGGALVFWPRIIPRTDDPKINALARSLQTEMAEVTRSTMSGKAVDVRPEPERVCPRDGCAAMTVGLLLTHVRGGCAVMGLVSESGKAPARIVPWAGRVKLKKEQVPFREYPENQVTIVDAVPCDDVMKSLEEGKKAISDAIRQAGG